MVRCAPVISILDRKMAIKLNLLHIRYLCLSQISTIECSRAKDLQVSSSFFFSKSITCAVVIPLLQYNCCCLTIDRWAYDVTLAKTLKVIVRRLVCTARVSVGIHRWVCNTFGTSSRFLGPAPNIFFFFRNAKNWSRHYYIDPTSVITQQSQQKKPVLKKENKICILIGEICLTYFEIGSFRVDWAVPNREQSQNEDEGHVSPHFVVLVFA